MLCFSALRSSQAKILPKILPNFFDPYLRNKHFSFNHGGLGLPSLISCYKTSRKFQLPSQTGMGIAKCIGIMITELL